MVLTGTMARGCSGARPLARRREWRLRDDASLSVAGHPGSVDDRLVSMCTIAPSPPDRAAVPGNCGLRKWQIRATKRLVPVRRAALRVCATVPNFSCDRQMMTAVGLPLRIKGTDS